ncbi:hypothetical protein H6P81_019373 [Aristolochia fimbriata]|uniref:C3H1-type domain-containing protein n=1 Tax=Aristolochia fimbriata TaxID=158543 RepID=A0AAV7DRI0_ARIFI|nr:hypothetical protein H6P81_019373 [Aristolochia fimbriata]
MVAPNAVLPRTLPAFLPPIPTPHLIICCVLNSLPHSLLTALPLLHSQQLLFFLFSSSSSPCSLLYKFLLYPRPFPFLPTKYEMPSSARTRYDLGDSSSDRRSPDTHAGDDFRMYEFKVRRCTRGRSHDWTDCPFAHPGEKARRRDPRRFHYSGNACPEFRRGGCPRGDACEYAHGVFECWLHPARYRTQPCRDGKSCRRKVCFFAHTPAQLRLLSPGSGSSSSSPGKSAIVCSCAFCPCKSPSAQLGSSPTSTLMAFSHLSPPLSPPLSPVYSTPVAALNYKSLLTELVGSLEAIDLSANSTVASPSASSTTTAEPAFLLSPASSLSRDYNYNYEEMKMNDEMSAEINGSFSNNINGCCPNLDWVNELVM